MKIKSLIFLLLIVIIVTSPGCLESKKSPVPNETKNATHMPSPNITEQEQPVNNETKLLKINDTFETWSRGYWSNTSDDRPDFKVITNYSDWNEFLDNQDPWFMGKDTMSLEGELFPGVNIIPRNLTSDNFNNYIIIVALMGWQARTGPDIEIKNIRRINNTVTVTVSIDKPGPGGNAISYPYHIVIVKREILPEGNSTFVFVSTEGKELEKIDVENK
ncbi:MAG: protease complex subunit PrcB family protein [Candidatus Methanoperedens sp.]